MLCSYKLVLHSSLNRTNSSQGTVGAEYEFKLDMSLVVPCGNVFSCTAEQKTYIWRIFLVKLVEIKAKLVKYETTKTVSNSVTQ